MVDRERLVDVLIASSRALVGAYRVDESLTRLCDDVVAVLPAEGAGVMLEDDEGVLRFVVASNDTVREIERLQIQLDEGPCLHAYRTGEQVVCQDLETDEQFPRFAPAAMAAGLRAVYSFPMHHGDDRIGAFNLYDEQPAAFTDADREAGQALADVATAMILNARELQSSNQLASQLQRALDSRVVIEQAKGVLAERHGDDVGGAFDRLRRYARSTGRRLQEVARDVVAGDLEIED